MSTKKKTIIGVAVLLLFVFAASYLAEKITRKFGMCKINVAISSTKCTYKPLLLETFESCTGDRLTTFAGVTIHKFSSGKSGGCL